MSFYSYFPLILMTISSIDSNLILIDPTQIQKGDYLIHKFKEDFRHSEPFRCLLQVESKFFYLDSSCQLLSRTSLKTHCSLEDQIRLELVFAGNTSVHQFKVKSNRTDCSSANSGEHSCQFEKNPYRIRLKENSLYQNFLQLKTVDNCQATNFILSSTNGKRNFDYFSLNHSTGFLSLINNLDFEFSANWKLVIQGEDKNQIQFYTYVIIDVDDVNDCPPLLSWNFPPQTIEIINETDPFDLRISIEESKLDHENVIIANLIASDLDSQLKFDLTIEKAALFPFRIDGPYGDSTFVLLTTERIDREIQETFILKLALRDSGQPQLTSFYRLTIDISDINDHRPEFEQNIYHVDIQENNLINTTLVQVFAKDSDSDENGRVSYQLEPIDREDLWIDPKSGIIRTKIRFDYETLKNFSFFVLAIDHPVKGEALMSKAQVIVRVINQNDNAPQFQQSVYDFSIHENNPLKTFLGQVTAQDDDHSELLYIIDEPTTEISSTFHLSSTDGKIFLLRSLNREDKNRYKFYIFASDGLKRSKRVEVRVRVLDLNDEIPRFTFPNDQNDTLIIDRSYWNSNDLICQIEVEDLDEIPNHTLRLINKKSQLRNYDYLNDEVHFDSHRFFLDEKNKLFFNSSNATELTEGVYHVAFKIIDGQKYFDEKILKLIVVNDYQNIESIVKYYDKLGLHLNNRIDYTQYHHTQSLHRLSFDQSNRLFLLSLCAVFTFILVIIACLFISLLKCRLLKDKLIPKAHLVKSVGADDSSKSSNNEKKTSLLVTNCYDYNDASSLIMKKDLIGSGSLTNDNSSLLDTINEKDIYDPHRNQIYSSWACSTTSRQTDSSTLHSFNPASPMPTIINQEFCPPKNSASMFQSPSEYAVAVVSSCVNPVAHTPVSSDDGFCGSSDISDPSIPNANNHLLISYRQPYILMKESILMKNTHSPSFISLSSTNVPDVTRRVRFNLESNQILDHSTKHSLDPNFQRIEQIYLSQDEDFEQLAINSTVV